MPVSMLVKCENCCYENFPQHRFCGMCAAELRLPGPAGTQPGPPPAPMAAPTPRRVPAQTVTSPRVKDAAEPPVSGPSFLGLGNEPTETRSVSYLLEDEPPSHRGKYVFALLLLLVALAIVGWHWREDIVSRLSLILGGKAQTNSSTSAGQTSARSPRQRTQTLRSSQPIRDRGNPTHERPRRRELRLLLRRRHKQEPIQLSRLRRINHKAISPKPAILRLPSPTTPETEPARLHLSTKGPRHELSQRRHPPLNQRLLRRKAKNISTETA